MCLPVCAVAAPIVIKGSEVLIAGAAVLVSVIVLHRVTEPGQPPRWTPKRVGAKLIKWGIPPAALGVIYCHRPYVEPQEKRFRDSTYQGDCAYWAGHWTGLPEVGRAIDQRLALDTEWALLLVRRWTRTQVAAGYTVFEVTLGKSQVEVYRPDDDLPI
jgi:hypothetical protein